MNRPRMFVIGDTDKEVEISISVLVGHAMIAISIIAVSAILFWVMRGNPQYVDALIAPVMSVIAAIRFYLDALSHCTHYRNTERQIDRELNIMLNQEIAGLYAQLREHIEYKYKTDNENPYWVEVSESPSKQMEDAQNDERLSLGVSEEYRAGYAAAISGLSEAAIDGKFHREEQ